MDAMKKLGRGVLRVTDSVELSIRATKNYAKELWHDHEYNVGEREQERESARKLRMIAKGKAHMGVRFHMGGTFGREPMLEVEYHGGAEDGCARCNLAQDRLQRRKW